MKIKICLFLLVLLMGLPSLAQEIQVKGTVLDESGEPIAGATILVKRTKNGVATDLDGKFHLTGVNSKDTLVVSYVGMKKIEVQVKPELTITLKSEFEQLEQVIVTAFGTSKRSAFTGSAVALNSAKLEQKQVTNVMTSLIGEVPGLQISPTTRPGGTSSLIVRGEGSINADNDPLIVLDGMPYEGEWNSINPADVESVTVLKDAASNALYGARGANGVIIITTKQGQQGKAVVTLDAKLGVNQRSTRDYERITNPGEYYEIYYKALYNYSIAQGNSAAMAHKYANETLFLSSGNGGLAYNVYTIPENEYLIGTNGKVNPNATLGRRIYRNGKVYTLYPDDWTDATYHDGLRQEYNLSISGGNDKAKIFVSVGYLNDEGIVDASDYERMSGRLKASYEAKKWLTVGANVGLTHSEQNTASESSSTTQSTGNAFSTAANIASIYPLYIRDANGNILKDSHGKVYDWGDNTYNELTRPSSSNANSLNSLQLDINESDRNAINADAFMDVSFLKDFKFTFKGGTSLSDNRATGSYNPYYGYYTSTGGSLTKSHSRRTTINLQQLINWNRSFNNHNVSVMLGHEYYKYYYTYLVATKRGAVDYENNQELNGYLTSPLIPESYDIKYNREGYFFRAMYDYAERYFAQVSFRRDASSRFHPDHRWGNFYSIGAAWIINKENWFNIAQITNLKLKASYGQQGNDQINGYFRYVDTYSINNVNGEVSLTFNTKGNPDITWETGDNLNVGLEFSLFNNRIGGDIEFYNRVTSDMLYKYTVPNTLGYSYYWDNIGDMRNRGIEIQLQGTPIHTSTLEWNINMNVAYEKQKITYMPESSKSQTTIDGYKGYVSGDYFIGEGLPLNTWYMPKYAGVSPEGLSQWYIIKDGEMTTTTNYAELDYDNGYFIFKSPRPVYGSIGSSLKIKNFDISLQFTYSIGGKGQDLGYCALMTVPEANSTGNAIHKDMLKAWTPEHTNTDIPRWQYGDQYTGYLSDRWLISNTYVTFQNFQVGYNLPKQWLSRIGINKARIYVTGDNLYLWSKRQGYDPRLSAEGSYGSYSPMRTISAGINLQF